MIRVETCRPDYSGHKETPFESAVDAKRFMRKMRREGYKVLGYECDDPDDAEAMGGR